jgi:hypothetical protein
MPLTNSAMGTSELFVLFRQAVAIDNDSVCIMNEEVFLIV